jgi:dCMP deaminase
VENPAMTRPAKMVVTRPAKDEYFLEFARVAATRSTCLRRSVGCILVNARGHVLATGYNGVATGLPHCNEEFHKRGSKWHPGGQRIFPHACQGAKAASGTDLDNCEAIHAEQNALLQCRDVWMIDTCYTTTAPCITCVKLLLATSCKRIVFLDDYPHANKSRRLWIGADRTWNHFNKGVGSC